MLSKLMCGAILASAAVGASAQTWNFSYTGFTFLGPDRNEFLPDATINGSFSGTDRNGDGVLDATELSSFIVHSFWNNDTEFTRCARDSNVYSSCSLQAFSFRPKDDLAFTVSWSGGDGFGSGWYGGIATGVWETVHTYNAATNSANGYSVGWLWSDQTKLVVSPAPEPSQAALTLAGLLVLGLARLPLTRRRCGGAMERPLSGCPARSHGCASPPPHPASSASPPPAPPSDRNPAGS
jgi:hypothetical protein